MKDNLINIKYFEKLLFENKKEVLFGGITISRGSLMFVVFLMLLFLCKSWLDFLNYIIDTIIFIFFCQIEYKELKFWYLISSMIQLPFLLGVNILEKLAAPMAPIFVGRTGSQLFLTDGKPNKPPLLLQMASDCEDGKFL